MIKRYSTRSKSNYFWHCHAKIEEKKYNFKSHREFFKYWEEKPYFNWWKVIKNHKLFLDSL